MKYRKCRECGTVLDYSERIVDYPKIPQELILCGCCVENISENCTICDKYWLEEELIEVDGCSVCPECYKTGTMICEKCGRITIRDRSTRRIKGLCRQCETEQIYKEFAVEKVSEDCYREAYSLEAFKRLHTTPIMTSIRRNNGILLINTGMGDMPNLIIVYGLPDNADQAYQESVQPQVFRRRV